MSAEALQVDYKNPYPTAEGRGWVPATLKSAVVVTGFVLLTLASYKQYWCLVPVGGGAALACSLLWAMDWFIRRAFTPERAWAAKRKMQQKRREEAKSSRSGDFTEKKTVGSAGGAMLMGFALIKYPLVAVLIWAVTRVWNLHAVMAFTGGFILIHLVIGLRAIGRMFFVTEPEAVK